MNPHPVYRLLLKCQDIVDSRKCQENPLLRLGLMTYNLGRDWDLETLIRNCGETKFEHAELRTTHKHGVEVSLSATQRPEVPASKEPLVFMRYYRALFLALQGAL